MDITVALIDDEACFRQKLKNHLHLLFANITAHEFSNLKETISEGHCISTAPPNLVFISESCINGDMSDFLKWLGQRLIPIVVTEASRGETPSLGGQSADYTSSGDQAYIMHREDIRSPLFKPFVQHLIEENIRVQHHGKEATLERIKEHIGTLHHEINNPLEVLFGTAYLFQHSEVSRDERRLAAQRIEQSGRKIKMALDTICVALEVGIQPPQNFSIQNTGLAHSATVDRKAENMLSLFDVS